MTKKLSRTDVLKILVDHFEAGGKPATTTSLYGGRMCVYLTEDGDRCAIGVLLPKIGFTDDEIRRVNELSLGSLFLSRFGGRFSEHLEPDVNFSYLHTLQQAHDACALTLALRKPECIANALKARASDLGVEL